MQQLRNARRVSRENVRVDLRGLAGTSEASRYSDTEEHVCLIRQADLTLRDINRETSLVVFKFLQPLCFHSYRIDNAQATGEACVEVSSITRGLLKGSRPRIPNSIKVKLSVLFTLCLLKDSLADNTPLRLCIAIVVALHNDQVTCARVYLHSRRCVLRLKHSLSEGLTKQALHLENAELFPADTYHTLEALRS